MKFYKEWKRPFSLEQLTGVLEHVSFCLQRVFLRIKTFPLTSILKNLIFTQVLISFYLKNTNIYWKFLFVVQHY